MKLFMSSVFALSLLGAAPAFSCECAFHSCMEAAKTDAEKKECEAKKAADCTCTGKAMKECGCKMKGKKDTKKG